jgi:hypothetical protein
LDFLGQEGPRMAPGDAPAVVAAALGFWALIAQ